MKALIVLTLLFSTPAFAWEKVVSCDGDMLVIDRQPNIEGAFDYQTVFRGRLIESMMDQRIIDDEDLNSAGEIVRSSNSDNGIIRNLPHVGFQLTNVYSTAGNYSLIFSSRNGQVGNYIFNSCWFKYRQQ